MKKLLSTVLLTLAVLMPTALWAQDGVAEPYAVLTGDTISGMTLTFYYDSEKTAKDGLSVGPFKGNPATPSWYDYRESIISVVFDASFANCTSLTSTRSWFYYCSNLTSISGIHNLKTDNVTNMSYMFCNCSRLTSLDVSGFKTDNVTDMGGMFYGCSGLTNLDLSSFDTSNVTNMAAMFMSCSGLVSLDLSGFNTEKVKSMNSMFQNCIHLTSLNLSGVNTTVVTNMGGMFNYCKELEILDLSSFDTSNVTNMVNMFFNCPKLKIVYVSNKWVTDAVKSGYAMFSDCSSLIGGQGTRVGSPNVADDYTYAHIDGGVTNPGYFTEKGASIPYAVLSTDYTVLTFYYDTNIENRGGIGPVSFRNGDERGWNDVKDKIISVVFDSSFADCTNWSTTAFWFDGCSALTNITGIDNMKTDNVKEMSFMFRGCSSLTSLDLSGFNTANVTSMIDLFYGCSNLASLEVSNFNIEKVTNMFGMFYGCSNLTSLDLSSFNTTSASSTIEMGSLFRNCANLKTIYAEGDWATSNTTDSNSKDMFYACKALIGGAGTTYSPAHVDVSYAHIDGGADNPGYFTDKNAPVVVAAPTFRFEGDLLFIETETEGASIFYRMEELPNMDEATIDKISSNMTVTADGQQSIYYEQPIELKKSVVLKAIAAGTTNSEVSTLVYDFDAWQKLLEALDYGMDVSGRGSDNSNVPDNMKEQLTHMLEEGKWVYYERMWDSNAVYNLTNEIMQLAHQIDEMMNTVNVSEAYAVLSADSLTVTFYYDNQKSVRGGVEINNEYIEEGEKSPYGTAVTAVFDASFADYRPTSTAYWFHDCSLLSSINGIENLKTDNVTNMVNMFCCCSSLTSLDVSGFKSDKVTQMNNMFEGCSSLTTIYAGSGWSAAKVVEGNNMFYGCSNMRGGMGTTYDADHTDYTYAHIDEGPSNPGYFTDKNAPVISDDIIQFADANVKAICVTNWDTNDDGELSKTETAAVTSIGTVFKGNTTIGSFNELKYFTGLQSLSIGAFEESSVTSLELPDGLIEIGSDAFSQCRQLKSIFIPATVSKMGSDSGMAEFWLCYNLETISVDENNKFYTAVDNVLFNKEMNKIIRYPAAKPDVAYEIPNTVTTINQNCFESCSSLMAVNIPASVTEMGYGVFQQCDNLITVTISDGVTVIGEDAFRSCKRLAHIHIPASVKQIGREDRSPENAFFWSDALMEITVDENNPYFMSDGGILYSKDKSIIAAYPPALTASEFTVPYGVTKISSCCFTGTENLKSIHFPETVVAYDNAAINISNSTLQSLTVMATTPATIENNAFSDAVYFATLYVPNGTVEAYKNATGWKEFKSIVEMEPDVNYSFDSFGVLWVDSDVTMAQVLEEASKMHNVAEHITAIVWHSSQPLTNSDLQEFDNPNMLIYVDSDSLAPQNRNNVVVGDFAKNIVLTDVASGNGSFYCPQAFTAEMISYTHEYKQKTEVGVSRGWETIALPFDVQTITHEKYGPISPFGRNDGNKHFWLRQLEQQGLTSADKIQAQLPYLISMPNSESYSAAYNLAGRVTFSTQNVVVRETLPYGIEIHNKDGEMVTLRATFSGVSKSAGVYALNVGEARGNNPEGSVFERDYREIRPFEAYTRHEGNGPAPQFIPVAGFTDGEATGIEDVRSLMSDGRGEGAWYDLNGRKLLQKPIKKGVYLNNGHKVVIR